MVVARVLLNHGPRPAKPTQLPGRNQIALPRGQLQQANVHFSSK
jgi:hypothetical protein